MDLPEPTRRLAARQQWVLTRAQLLETGVSAAAVRWNVGRRWRVLLPGVLKLGMSRPSRPEQLMAAQLFGGEGAVIGGAAAASLYGIGSASGGGLVRVLVPASRGRRRVGWADVHPSSVPDPFTVAQGSLRLSSRARATVDAAMAAPSDEQCLAIVLEAVQRRITTVADLDAVLNLMNRRHTARTRQALEIASDGAWSVPESTLLRLLRDSPLLPEVWPNPILEDAKGAALVSPDAWLDDVAMAVMVHSRRYHSEGKDFDDTLDQDGTLTAAGIVVLPVTPNRLARSPNVVLRRVEATYAGAQLRPRPAVTAERRYLGRW